MRFRSRGRNPKLLGFERVKRVSSLASSSPSTLQPQRRWRGVWTVIGTGSRLVNVAVIAIGSPRS